VRHEMATTLVDVLTRRTRAHLHDRAGVLAAAAEVARLLGPSSAGTTPRSRSQVAAYRRCAMPRRLPPRIARP
jgi:glycerol-3-phosphate dehydrogenase